MTNKKDDTTKDLVVGATAIAAAITGLPGMLTAGLVSLASLAITRVNSRDNRRAQQLFERMAEADGSPEAFVKDIRQRLEAEDESTLTAFRALLVAAVEAISPDSIIPLGFIGRRYLRGECPTWIARGALEVLQQVDSADLKALRRLLVEIESIKDDTIMVSADLPTHGWCAYSMSHDNSHPITPFPSANRIFGYLKRAGLGTDTSAYGIGGSPAVVEIDRAAADALREALVATEARPAPVTTRQ